MTALPPDQETEKAVSAQSCLRSLLSKGEGLKDGRSASEKPGGFLAAPKFLSGAFLFPRESLKQGLNKNRVPLRGASLSQTHCIDFSTKNNFKRAPCTSDKALQLAGLSGTGGSAAFSQQPSKQPVPRL